MKQHLFRFKHIATDECATINILKYPDMETARKAASKILGTRLARMDSIRFGTNYSSMVYEILPESIKETDLHE